MQTVQGGVKLGRYAPSRLLGGASQVDWLVAELREAIRNTPGVLIDRGTARNATVYAVGSRASVLPGFVVKKFWR